MRNYSGSTKNAKIAKGTKKRNDTGLLVALFVVSLV
jgi:hypothetical protein